MNLPPAIASKQMFSLFWIHPNLLMYFYPSSWFQIMLSISISLAPHSSSYCVRSSFGQRVLAEPSLENPCPGIRGFEFERLPSCFYFPSLRLALSVYVDDLTLSGPSANHSKFWEVLRKVVQLEDPAPLSQVLGRGHIKHDGGLVLHPTDFARQCVKLFEELSGKHAKHVRTPHVVKVTFWLLIRLTEGSYPTSPPSLWWSLCGLVVSADKTLW